MNMPAHNTNGTERLIIRLMERDDLEDLRILHNADDVLLKLSDPAHVSQVQQEVWFQSASLSKTSRRYVARLRTNNQMAGMFRIDSIDFVNGNCFVGCDISPQFQGQGYATEFYDYILDYLFGACRLNRVELVTLKDNDIAQNLYKKLGFVVEGERREAIFRDGHYKNLVAMGLLATEWQKVQSKE
jgi:diamine N-acetyltransferase